MVDMSKIVSEYEDVEKKVVERRLKRGSNDWKSDEIRRDCRDVIVGLKSKGLIEENVIDMSVLLKLLKKGDVKYEKLDMSRLRSSVIYGGMFELEGDRSSGKKLRLKKV
jgi:hypothetical protein